MTPVDTIIAPRINSKDERGSVAMNGDSAGSSKVRLTRQQTDFVEQICEIVAMNTGISGDERLLLLDNAHRSVFSCAERGLSMFRSLVVDDLVEPAHLAELYERRTSSKNVDPSSVTKECLAVMPVDLAEKYKVAPILLMDSGQLEVMYSREYEPSANERREISEAVGLPCVFTRGSTSTVSAVRARQEAVSDAGDGDARDASAEGAKIYESLIGPQDDAAKELQRIFSSALSGAASDIHFDSVQTLDGDLEVQCRIRFDGDLREEGRWSNTLGKLITNRIRTIGNMPSSRQKPASTSIPLTWPDVGRFDLRLATAALSLGRTLVIRMLRQDASTALTVDDVLPVSGHDPIVREYNSALRDEVLSSVANTEGLFLVAGRTGDGKSTTLAAVMKHLRGVHRKLITVEDPVEYLIEGAQQIPVTKQTSFAEILRTNLRLDPDVLMVGEIRDQETATIAMQAAQSGHLMLSTVHARSAGTTVRRLVDIGANPAVLADELQAILSQRLIKRLCQLCSEEGFPQGCKSCKDGWVGRMAIFEVMRNTPQVASAVEKTARGAELELLDGYWPFKLHAAAALRGKATTREQIARAFSEELASEAVQLATSGRSLLKAKHLKG